LHVLNWAAWPRGVRWLLGGIAAAVRRHARRDIKPIHLNGADLTGADLRDAKLGGADLTEATLAAANLRNADL
jgi:uncharacterized protein YjbI with pentapeptide repeats